MQLNNRYKLNFYTVELIKKNTVLYTTKVHVMFVDLMIKLCLQTYFFFIVIVIMNILLYTIFFFIVG